MASTLRWNDGTSGTFPWQLSNKATPIAGAHGRGLTAGYRPSRRSLRPANPAAIEGSADLQMGKTADLYLCRCVPTAILQRPARVGFGRLMPPHDATWQPTAPSPPR